MSARVLCLVFEGLEEIETITPVDLLRRAGVEVVMASLTSSIHVTGRSGITLHADATIDGLEVEGFDLLMIPGGPGVQQVRADGRAAALSRTFAEAGKPVAAICAAPSVLHDAGLLHDRRYTSHSAVRQELTAAIADEDVVIDRGVITSKGAGTALEFGLALVELLTGLERRREVEKGIML
jgi:4-methyl-5(b-hydroxyethyl)-thiazole monophosphate biosynthesis